MKSSNLFAIFVAFILLLGMNTYVHAAPANEDTNDAFWWWGDDAGASRTVRTDKGIKGTIKVHLGNDLGSAYGLTITLWIVIFNNPEYCAVPYMCGDDADFANPDVMPDVVYGGGTVVDASEKARIGFRYRAGNNAGSIADLFFLPVDDGGNSFGLMYPRSAEVHYVIRFHGPEDPAYMPAQIKSYGGGCIDFAPYGYPFPTGPDDLYLGSGQCQDVIFSINPSPSSP